MGDTPASPVTPLDRMKQWVFDKLQKDISIDVPLGDQGPKRESLSGPVPKIIISEENYPNLTVRRGSRPSPLKRTWVNYDLESPATNISPTGTLKMSPVSIQSLPAEPSSRSPKKTWLNYSPLSQKHNAILKKTHSVPVSPDCTANKPKPYWSASYNKSDLESPLYKYVVNKAAFTDSSNTLSTQSQSPDKRSISEQQYQFPGQIESPTTSEKSFDSPHIRRNLSVRSTNVCSMNPLISKEELRKTGSQSDIPKVEEEILSQKRNSMKRSWSINLDPLSLLKNDSTKAEKNRKCSLNETELRCRRERRRSSILRLFCMDSEETDCRNDQEGAPTGVDSGTPQCTSDKIRRHETKEKPFMGITSTDYKDKSRIPNSGLALLFNNFGYPSDWGSVKVRFQYFNKSHEFHVSLIRGFNIGNDRSEPLRIFVKLCLLPGKLQSKTGRGYHDTNDPVFYETFYFKNRTLGGLFESRLRIRFYNKNGLFTRKEPLGETVIPLFNYDLTAETLTWLHLRQCVGQEVCINVMQHIAFLDH